MKKTYLKAGILVMLLSMILFAAGFAVAVTHKASGIPTPAVILIITAIVLLAVTSLLVFLGMTKGDFIDEKNEEKSLP